VHAYILSTFGLSAFGLSAFGHLADAQEVREIGDFATKVRPEFDFGYIEANFPVLIGEGSKLFLDGFKMAGLR
jgi:hypothetical protein